MARRERIEGSVGSEREIEGSIESGDGTGELLYEAPFRWLVTGDDHSHESDHDWTRSESRSVERAAVDWFCR